MSVLRRSLSCGLRRHLSTYDPIQEALMDEQCILVDEQDRPLGQASKRTCHQIDPTSGKSPLHRAFSLFIFNSRNELLLQQRSDKKITFPGLWTNTCCSHPLATIEESVSDGGKGVKLAAQRRVFNELGIKSEECPIEQMSYLTRILYAATSSDQWAEHELDYIIFLKRDVTPDPNPNEVKNIAFVSEREFPDFLAEVQKKGEGITPWFDLIVKNFLSTWWKNLDKLDKFQDHKKIKKFS